jgi:hypothetical protein
LHKAVPARNRNRDSPHRKYNDRLRPQRALDQAPLAATTMETLRERRVIAAERAANRLPQEDDADESSIDEAKLPNLCSVIDSCSLAGQCR